MKRTFGLWAVSLALLAMASAAQAHTYLGTVQITCTTFTAAGTGADILDRDNTGAGQERLTIDVRDGFNTLLYTLTFQNALGSYAGGLINTTVYTTLPKQDPITVTVTSLAGNALPQIVQTIGVGACGNVVPATSPSGLIAMATLLAVMALGTLYLRRRR
jgi:hypothetical protein